MSMTSKIVSGLRRKVCAGLALGLGFLAFTEKTASAQEILLTGPLAGAPAVRKQKLYRRGRFEIAPTVSFTLLDEYQRQILIGGRLQYNLTDWIGIGVWGATGAVLKITTGLSEDIQSVNAQRRAETAARAQAGQNPTPNGRLTQANLGPDFTKQLGTLDWVLAPQITLVPFRGKIALFQSIFADTDLYIFGGPAFVGLKERSDCGSGTTIATCSSADSFALKSRTAIAPTFGLGLSFYFNKFMSFGAEWRGMPFSRNTGGFDNHGGGPNQDFPDYKVNADDREFKFNQMLTLSLGFNLPTQYKVSE
jgi:hypothetical protein